MKLIIDLPEETLNYLSSLGEKKGWSRKQYIEWQLTYHAKLNKSRNEARIKKQK